MKKTRFLLRIGICTIIIGFTIILANISSQTGSKSTGNLSIPPNGTYSQLLIPLRNHAYEFRIVVPKAFEGKFYLFNYEGIRKLAEEGTRTPMLEEKIKGPTHIDVTINRRGTYMILIESNVSDTIQGSINIVEKEGLSQDILQDATIITILGIATTALATIPKITSLRKHQH